MIGGRRRTLEDKAEQESMYKQMRSLKAFATIG